MQERKNSQSKRAHDERDDVKSLYGLQPNQKMRTVIVQTKDDMQQVTLDQSLIDSNANTQLLNKQEYPSSSQQVFVENKRGYQEPSPVKRPTETEWESDGVYKQKIDKMIARSLTYESIGDEEDYKLKLEQLVAQKWALKANGSALNPDELSDFFRDNAELRNDDSLFQPTNHSISQQVEVKTKITPNVRKHLSQAKRTFTNHKGKKKGRKRSHYADQIDQDAPTPSKNRDNENHAFNDTFIQKVLQTSQKIQRLKSIRKLPSGKTLTDDNIVWHLISDKEYVRLYGPDSLRDNQVNIDSDEDSTLMHKASLKLQSKSNCCKKGKKKALGTESEYDYKAEEMEMIDQQLFDTLEKEKKARFNWRKIMTMIQLVKALSSTDKLEKQLVPEDEEEEEKVSCWKFIWADKYVQKPNKLWMVIWTALALSVNTISIFLVSYECAFHLTASSDLGAMSDIFEVILCLEVLVMFFKSYPSNQDHEGWLFSVFKACGLCKKKKNEKEDFQSGGRGKVELFEVRFVKVALKYLSGVFIFDFLSVYPYFFARLANSHRELNEMMEIDYMRLFGYMRLLRITQIPKILGATSVYASILAKAFPFQQRVIDKVKQLFSLALFLYLSLHLTACINIYHGTIMDGGWIPVDDETGAPSENTAFEIYIQQLYFMTTTMTTVGYGDNKAAQRLYGDYESFDSMVLISFIQFLAIFTFTLIKERLFSLEIDVKLEQVISETQREAEMFIYQIDMTMKNIYENRRTRGLVKVHENRTRFDPDMWNDFMNTVEIEQRQSCYEAFIVDPFYEQLPPRLQDKLIQDTLVNIEEVFTHFFRNMETNEICARPVINRILSQLKCRIYPVGANLFSPGCELDRIYFVFKGMLHLTSNFDSAVYEHNKILVAKLPEGSFFGELPTLLGITVFFGLEVGARDDKTKGERLIRNGYQQSLIYELDKETFLDICKDYPDFKTNIYIRGEIRVAYFKHLNQLRKGEFGYNMKILQIEKRIKDESTRKHDRFFKQLSEMDEDKEEMTLGQARDHALRSITNKLIDLRRSMTELYGPMFTEELTSALINRVLIMHEGVRLLDPTKPSDQYLLMRNTTYHSNINKKLTDDDFSHAANCYLMRRCRRIFLQLHHTQTVSQIYNCRWNNFMSSMNTLIKPEQEITEERNYGAHGVNHASLLQIAQLSFKRRQEFVRKSIEAKKKYELTFQSADEIAKKKRQSSLKQLRVRGSSRQTLQESRQSSRPHEQVLPPYKLNDTSEETDDEAFESILKRLSRSRMLRYEDMTVFARFKYNKDKPALRVHVWDIFDFANLNTTNFGDLFASIYEQLVEVYEEQGFEEDVHEVAQGHVSIESEGDEVPPSEDSANEMLVNDIGEITKFNVFARNVDESDLDDALSNSQEEQVLSSQEQLRKVTPRESEINNLRSSEGFVGQFEFAKPSPSSTVKTSKRNKERKERLKTVQGGGNNADGLFLPNPATPDSQTEEEVLPHHRESHQNSHIESTVSEKKKSDRDVLTISANEEQISMRMETHMSQEEVKEQPTLQSQMNLTDYNQPAQYVQKQTNVDVLKQYMTVRSTTADPSSSRGKTRQSFQKGPEKAKQAASHKRSTPIQSEKKPNKTFDKHNL